MTTEDFIKRANKVHNNFFDYSKVTYVNCMSKVCIICPIHGEFMQRASHHLDGHGCSKCYHDRQKKIQAKTTEDFIKQCKSLFGDKYSYNNTNYINNRTYVCITCPTHGDFSIIPSHFLKGYGCKKCSKRYRYTTKEWIDLANEVHKERYEYSKTEYIDKNKKVCIICPEHGEFWQLPRHHLNGCGCPKCYNKNWHLEEEIEIFLKENNILYERQKKFEWLKNKRGMSLDFYLNKYKIAIECQGTQHFKPIDFFGGENAFSETIKRDKLKEKLCNENGVTLLYFSRHSNNTDTIINDKNKLLKEIQKHGTFSC